MYLRITPLASLVKTLTQSEKAPHVAGVHFQVSPDSGINRHATRSGLVVSVPRFRFWLRTLASRTNTAATDICVYTKQWQVLLAAIPSCAL